MQVLEFLAGNMPAGIAVAGILGLLVGSFLNVVIYRLPVMMEREWTSQCKTLLEVDEVDNVEDDQEAFNLVTPNSHCPKCDSPIKAWQNIPVVSYLMLGGKCHNCKTPISKRYPIIEFVTGLLSCLVIWHFGANWQGGAMLLLTWALVTLTMIDFDHQLLPDSITLPFLWLGLIANSFGLFCSLPEALWGAVFGYLSLWSVYWLFKLVTGKEGMGHGDFKLLAVLGAWFGWQVLPMIILLSSLVGAIVGIFLLVLKNKGKSVPIPFGPYLAAAGFIAAIWGEELTRAYLNYAGL
jgi:leader peptidase (prepilin peptidase) / N-methyltransferase